MARERLRRDQSTIIQRHAVVVTYTFGIRKNFAGFRYSGKRTKVYFPTPEKTVLTILRVVGAGGRI
jgi:hypothetical protein